jgi:hypothetical protein
MADLRLFLVALTGAAFGSCAKEPSVKEQLIADAKAAVAATLKDPDSAKFRGMKAYPGKKLVCGEVNGKNSYGAYSGFSTFFYDGGFVQIADHDSIFYPHYEELCFGALREEGKAALDRAERTWSRMEDSPEKQRALAEIRELRRGN